MATFLHAADIHLDSPLRGLDSYEGAPVEALRGATRRAFENLVGLALDEAVDFLVLSGDLYDGDWKDYNTGLFLVNQLARLRRAAIPVFVIAGNHDAANRMTRSLELPDNTTVFDSGEPTTHRLDPLGIALHGQSFAAAAVTEDLSRAYPEPVPGLVNIGLLHTSVTGREGHEPYAPCTLEALVHHGYDYWALGHVHHREILSEGPHVVFPGNLQGRHVREEGAKGCMKVEVDGSGAIRCEFRPLDVLRWTTATIDATDHGDIRSLLGGFDEALERGLAASDGRPLAMRVVITGRTELSDHLAADGPRWTQEIRSRSLDRGDGRVWIEDVRIITSRPSGGRPGLEGPLDEIRALVDEVRLDEALLEQLAGEIDDLARKLPPELRASPDAVRPRDPDWLRQALDRVPSLLEHRLLGRGRSE